MHGSTYLYPLDTFGSILDFQANLVCGYLESSSLCNFHALQSSTNYFRSAIPHREWPLPIGPLYRTGANHCDETRLHKQLSTGRVYTAADHILHTELGVGIVRHSGNAQLISILDNLIKKQTNNLLGEDVINNVASHWRTCNVWNTQSCLVSSKHFI